MNLPEQRLPRAPLSREAFEELIRRAEEAAASLRSRREEESPEPERVYAGEKQGALVAPLKSEGAQTDLAQLPPESETAGFIPFSQGELRGQMQSAVAARFGAEAGTVTWTELPGLSGPALYFSFERPAKPSGRLRQGLLYREGAGGQLKPASEDPEPARRWALRISPAQAERLGPRAASFEATISGSKAHFQLTLD